jgi:hypothetical protein
LLIDVGHSLRNHELRPYRRVANGGTAKAKAAIVTAN